MPPLAELWMLTSVNCSTASPEEWIASAQERLAMTGWGFRCPTSFRANGSRKCAPDDRLREAIQQPRSKSWIASSQALLAMTLRVCSLDLGARHGGRARLPAATQKPAAQGCGRVLGGTIHFDENTTTHWTSQAGFDPVVHRRWITAPPRGRTAGSAVTCAHESAARRPGARTPARADGGSDNRGDSRGTARTNRSGRGPAGHRRSAA
jgi:hypothetical protein